MSLLTIEPGNDSLLPLPAFVSPYPVVRRAATVLAGTGLLALCAHIALPLPFTPVPGTMQTFAVLLLGMVLGPVLGPITVVAYLLEGLAGLPVFAPTTIPGPFLGPTAGYLLAFPVAAFVAAVVYRALSQVTRALPSAIIAGTAASVPVLFLGAAWLAVFLHLSPRHAIELGVVPFLSGEAVKLVLAAIAVAALHRLRPTT